jgi:hypothetical protein
MTMSNVMAPLVMGGVVVLTLAFDFQNLIARFKHAVPLTEESSSDYTMVVPLFGNPRILTNMPFLGRYKANVLLVLNTTNDAMVEFAQRMESEGWRVHRTSFLDKPRVSRLWEAGMSVVETTYALRVDADTVSPEDPGRAIRALELSGADYASAKVLVKNPRSLAEHLQATEYAMSMQARHFRPWMTSGACIMGRTTALRKTLSMHTHWGTGEDVEQGIIAKHYRMRVVHIGYKAYTDAPSTFRALFRQRRLWWAGSARHTIMNFDQMLWFPAYACYNLLLVYAGFALRGHFLTATPLEFAVAVPVMLTVYVAITSIANYQVWSKWFFVFPVYSLLQAVVMPGIGVIEFVRIAVEHRSSGRYLIRWRRESWNLEHSLKGIV